MARFHSIQIGLMISVLFSVAACDVSWNYGGDAMSGDAAMATDGSVISCTPGALLSEGGTCGICQQGFAAQHTRRCNSAGNGVDCMTSCLPIADAGQPSQICQPNQPVDSAGRCTANCPVGMTAQITAVCNAQGTGVNCSITCVPTAPSDAGNPPVDSGTNPADTGTVPTDSGVTPSGAAYRFVADARNGRVVSEWADVAGFDSFLYCTTPTACTDSDPVVCPAFQREMPRSLRISFIGSVRVGRTELPEYTDLQPVNGSAPTICVAYRVPAGDGLPDVNDVNLTSGGSYYRAGTNGSTTPRLFGQVYSARLRAGVQTVLAPRPRAGSCSNASQGAFVQVLGCVPAFACCP